MAITFQEYSKKIKEYFSASSPLQSIFPDYEYRPQQEKMASAVMKNLCKEKTLIIEAGTGIGKSLAYLLPTFLKAIHENNIIVISTFTINLQEQLINKDIPLIQKLFEENIPCLLFKGRENYICLRKLNAAILEEEQMLLSADLSGPLKKILKWSQTTSDGSLSDLDFIPRNTLWGPIASRTARCLRKECFFYEKCLYQKIRKNIDKARLLVVNHHLLIADAIMKMGGKSILPEYDHLIIDEAHCLEHVASGYLGINLSYGEVEQLIDILYDYNKNTGFLVKFGADEIIGNVIVLKEKIKKFFQRLNKLMGPEGMVRITDPIVFHVSLYEDFSTLKEDIDYLQRNTKDAEKIVDLTSYMMQFAEIIEKIKDFCEMKNPANVYWLEKASARTKNVRLRSAPLSVGKGLNDILFSKHKGMVLTSATLAVNKNFSYMNKRLGLSKPDELILGSPFNYETQMRIHISTSMPDPREGEAYIKGLEEKIEHHIGLSQGRAFVLFTNRLVMEQVFNSLKDKLESLGLNVLMQGINLPRDKMLSEFRKDTSSVLFGLSSFWMGVDVKGESLSNVIITRLPFSVPDHPLVKARFEDIQQNRGDPFAEYSLPEAILRFKQGVGRLIRTTSDEGIIVILDNRVITKFYGKKFIEAIPKCETIIEK